MIEPLFVNHLSTYRNDAFENISNKNWCPYKDLPLYSKIQYLTQTPKREIDGNNAKPL